MASAPAFFRLSGQPDPFSLTEYAPMCTIQRPWPSMAPQGLFCQFFPRFLFHTIAFSRSSPYIKSIRSMIQFPVNELFQPISADNPLLCYRSEKSGKNPFKKSCCCSILFFSFLPPSVCFDVFFSMKTTNILPSALYPANRNPFTKNF